MVTKEKTYKYSEIFHSFQGEGAMVGRSCAWIRFFLCNLQCNGFGQKDPTDPSTYVLPYKTFDVSAIKRVEDLPVWDYGCDSSYTWAKNFRHLMHDDSATVICDKIQDVLKHPTNPGGQFLHVGSDQEHHMCFTGGEPMLPRNQDAMVAILTEFNNRQNLPINITVETNGTKPIKPGYVSLIDDLNYATGWSIDWFWSVSPKLWSTSGETPKKAIIPASVASYTKIIESRGQLKYVVNGSPESWDEVELHTEAFRKAGVLWPVYIMAVGATKESQETDDVANIAMEAMKRGYYFSGRLHCSTFGNKVGT